MALLFNYMTGFGRPAHFNKILVAPFGLPTRLIDRIRAVGQAAADGKGGRIRLKLNALTDETIIDELYAASQRGARIEIPRGRSPCSGQASRASATASPFARSSGTTWSTAASTRSRPATPSSCSSVAPI